MEPQPEPHHDLEDPRKGRRKVSKERRRYVREHTVWVEEPQENEYGRR